MTSTLTRESKLLPFMCDNYVYSMEKDYKYFCDDYCINRKAIRTLFMCLSDKNKCIVAARSFCNYCIRNQYAVSFSFYFKMLERYDETLDSAMYLYYFMKACKHGNSNLISRIFLNKPTWEVVNKMCLSKVMMDACQRGFSLTVKKLITLFVGNDNIQPISNNTMKILGKCCKQAFNYKNYNIAYMIYKRFMRHNRHLHDPKFFRDLCRCLNTQDT